MLKQNKGKDLHKIPMSRLDTKGPYYCSKKFDGHYTQIIFDGTNTRFYTSGGKRFYLAAMAEYISSNFNHPFHIECEYSRDCEGKLGDRGKSAMLTTYRTEFNKGNCVAGNGHKDQFRVLDILDTEYDLNFGERLNIITQKFYHHPLWFSVPVQTIVTLDEGIRMSKEFYAEGYEGAMLKHSKHIYKPGKRVNDIIKLKPRKTVDLTVINWREGTGKYEGMLGSLLFKDEDGVTVWAGSGLSDADRSGDVTRFYGRVYEIEYESFKDTYIQPIIKHRREDKE